MGKTRIEYDTYTQRRRIVGRDNGPQSDYGRDRFVRFVYCDGAVESMGSLQMLSRTQNVLNIPRDFFLVERLHAASKCNAPKTEDSSCGDDHCGSERLPNHF